jgi:hypothetical protein
VSPDLDRAYARRNTDKPETDGPADRAQRGALWLRGARIRREIGDGERADQLLERIVRDASGTDAAAEAEALHREWKGR